MKELVGKTAFAGAGSPPYDVSKYGVVALSEGLRPSLARRGIGVSVLCPGFVRTNFARNARDYVPERISAAAVPQQASDSVRRLVSSTQVESVKEAIARIDHGIDPLHVGELVREGIENDWPYIFTDTEFEPAIDARFAEIKRGFDRIRSRASSR
jgi:NAD(P)-dependent dehydrogenase (short-subunit alcohol dehydrogenase family)